MQQGNSADELFDGLDARTKCEFLAICYRDLLEAAEAMDLFTTDFGLPEQHAVLLKRCIAEAAIVRYSRPFFKSYVNDKTKAKLPDSFRASFSIEQESLHQRICEIRASLVGHSDIGYAEMKQFQILWPGTEQRIHTGKVSKFMSEEIKDLVQMIDLVRELGASINWSLQRYADEIGEFMTPARKSPPYE